MLATQTTVRLVPSFLAPGEIMPERLFCLELQKRCGDAVTKINEGQTYIFNKDEPKSTLAGLKEHFKGDEKFPPAEGEKVGKPKFLTYCTPRVAVGIAYVFDGILEPDGKGNIRAL